MPRMMSVAKGGRMDWREDYSVGISEIDGQHQILIDCITLLEKAVSRQERWSAMHAAVVQLSDFARIHFAVEESLMRIHGYSGLADHIDEHRKFSSELKKLQEKALKVDVTREMIAFLHEWLHEHIMTRDKDYAFHLRSVSVKPPAAPMAAIRKWLHQRLIPRHPR